MGPSEAVRAAETQKLRDWDLVQAIARHWAGELSHGEMVVLLRLIDQVYLYTKGGTERALTARFLVDGEIGGEQIIPPLPFGRRQYQDHLSKLRGRGLVEVTQPSVGASMAIYRLNVAQILACRNAIPEPKQEASAMPTPCGQTAYPPEAEPQAPLAVSPQAPPAVQPHTKALGNKPQGNEPQYRGDERPETETPQIRSRSNPATGTRL